MTFKTVITAAALVASIGFSPSLATAQDVVVLHEKLSFDDLDLSRPAGARVVLERIAAASVRVCRPVESPRDLAMWAERRQCMTKSVRDAVADLHAPLVEALYEGRSPAKAYELAMRTALPTR